MPAGVVTRYYRFSAAVSDSLRLFSSYHFGLYLRYGAVVYINGVEQFRFNMPEGDVDRYTPPSRVEEEHTIHS